MRPRYTWSAVSACSESRDRFLKFGRGHFRYLPEMTSYRRRPRPNFKNLSRDSEQADTADHVYRGLIRVRLIVSEKSACLCLQCENSIGAKITPEKQGGRV